MKYRIALLDLKAGEEFEVFITWSPNTARTRVGMYIDALESRASKGEQVVLKLRIEQDERDRSET